MITYPRFAAELAGRNLDELASLAGVPAAEIVAIAAGGWAASLVSSAALARALGADEAELFRAVSSPLGVELEPLPCVTDAATLRIIDRPRAGAA